MSDEPIVIRYTWTADEMITAVRRHERSRALLNRRLLFRVVALITFVGAIFSAASHDWIRSGAHLFLTLILITLPWLNEWWYRREFKKRPDNGLEIVWHVTDNVIQTEMSLGKSETSWEAIHQVVLTPEGILLYPIPRLFHWLPRHGFATSAAYEEMIRLVQSNVKQVKVIK